VVCHAYVEKCHKYKSGEILYTVFAALIGTAFMLRIIAPDENRRLGALLRDRKLYSNELAPEANAALHFLIDGSGDQRPWRINSVPEPGILTAIFFSERKLSQRKELRRFNRTIAWVAEDQTILIDVDYLRQVALRLAWPGRSVGDGGIENPYARSARESNIYRVFLIWVLAHELGHAALHHGSSHFNASIFESPARATKVQQMREMQADEFAAARISRSAAQVNAVSGLLIEILDAELDARLPKAKLYGPMIHFFSHESVDVLAYSSHPEFVVRAARILAEMHYPPGTNDQFGVWGGGSSIGSTPRTLPRARYL
jgi:hypothetical protein